VNVEVASAGHMYGFRQSWSTSQSRVYDSACILISF